MNGIEALLLFSRFKERKERNQRRREKVRKKQKKKSLKKRNLNSETTSSYIYKFVYWPVA
jgi:hypothetical protein